MGEAQIRGLREGEDAPRDLLLLADPSPEAVDSYLARGRCFVAELGGEIVGEYVLIDTRPQTGELVNIAVSEQEQGRGLGQKLVQHAISWAHTNGYKTIGVGTGNSSIGQLVLYQKCGFRMVGVDRDFFT